VGRLWRNTLFTQGFSGAAHRGFDPNGERQVSEASALWFRNRGRGDRTMRIGINRKFTGRTNPSIFLQICGELSSLQALAIYR
jgi:hypothetical protein